MSELAREVDIILGWISFSSLEKKGGELLPILRGWLFFLLILFFFVRYLWLYQS